MHTGFKLSLRPGFKGKERTAPGRRNTEYRHLANAFTLAKHVAHTDSDIPDKKEFNIIIKTLKKVWADSL